MWYISDIEKPLNRTFLLQGTGQIDALKQVLPYYQYKSVKILQRKPSTNGLMKSSLMAIQLYYYYFLNNYETQMEREKEESEDKGQVGQENEAERKVK